MEAGRFQEAQSAAEALVDMLEKAEAPFLTKTRATNLLVETRRKNGRGADAGTRAIAERVLRSQETRPEDDATLGDSVRNMADLLADAGEAERAVALLQRAVSIHVGALGASHREVAEDLDDLARALMLVDRNDDALAANAGALRIKEVAFPPDDVRISTTLETLGTLLQRNADYPGSRQVLERALSLRQAVNRVHPATAGTLALLSRQSLLQGDLVTAKLLSEEALGTAEATLRPGHPDLAWFLRVQAQPIADMGDLVRARALRERALRLAERALGSDHPDVAVQFNDLGNSLVLEGEYAQALPLYERALRSYERRLGLESDGATTATYNLGIANARLGDFTEARRLFDRAIASWTRARPTNPQKVARALTALAEMLGEEALDAEAKPIYERALKIREQTLDPTHRDVARTLTLLAMTEAKLGHLTRAIQLSMRAIDIWNRSKESDSRRAADALVVHGTLQANQGNYKDAQASYDRALLILRRIVGPAHPHVAAAQISLAEAFALERQSSEAIRNAIGAEEIDSASLRLTLRYLPERQALSYAAKRAKGLDVALSVLDMETAAAPLVLDAVIHGRALVLDEMAARHRGAADFSPDVAPLWTTLTSARQRLANLVVRGPGQQRPEQYLALVDEARREKELAERALAEKSSAFSAELAQTEIGLERVRAALPPDSALLSFVRYDRMVLESSETAGAKPASTPRPYPARTIPSYAAFVLHARESAPRAIDLGEAEAIDKLVAQWRTQVMAGLTQSSPAPRAAERSLRITGTRLRERVWDPIAKELGDANRLFVVPDGPLNLVPLAALPIGQTDYVLEKGPVLHYLSAERDLVSWGGSQNVGKGLLALGGASFDDVSLFATLAKPRSLRGRATAPARSQKPAATSAGQSAEPSTTTTPFRGMGPECPSFQSLTFDPLPASGREAHDVAKLWTEFGSEAAGEVGLTTVLTGRGADERTFKQRAPGHRVLQIATHGFFLGSACTAAPEGTRSVGGLVSKSKPVTPAGRKPSTPPQPQPTTAGNPLLQSGLAMAGANRRAAADGEEDDGILTAEEVASLNLDGVEWAVLSACDTGLGEIKAGEGVFGLRRAFQVAGARTVIMSLWSVEDRSAMEWMRALYEGRLRRGLDTADAVREASLAVLRQRRARGQSVHPFYWAGFVASGDWR